MGTHSSNKANSIWGQLFKALPIIIFAGLVPLLVGYTQYIYPPVGVSWNPNGINGADLFNLVKARGIMLSGVLSIIYLFFTITMKRQNLLENKTFLAVVAMVVMLFCSLLFSFNKYVAVIGAYERFEGVLVWLSYIACALYTAWLFKEKVSREIVLKAILFSGLFITGIGVCQYVSFDLFKWLPFQKMILPAEAVGKIGFIFEKGRIYSTLYNPNYVAFYVAMMLPFSALMIFWEESKVFKGLWVLYSILLGICLLGSEGRGGMLGLAGAAIAVAVIYLLKKINNPKVSIAIITLGTVIVISACSFLAMGKITKVKGDVVVNTTQVSDIQIDKDNVHIQYGKNQINLKMDTQNLTSMCQVVDENGEPIAAVKDANNFFNIQDERYPNAKYLYAEAGEGVYYIELQLDNVSWPFIMQKEGFKFINNFGALSAMKPVDRWGFEGSERVGSNRGYIWSRALPVFFKAPIFGNGPDNFAFVFPQEDYVSKQIYYEDKNILVDKPHNFYIQMLTSFGLFGAIALYAIFGISVSFIYNRFVYTHSRDKWLYLAVLCGIFGYLGAGMFYDSTVNVSPVFWTFIGVGLQGFFGEGKLTEIK